MKHTFSQKEKSLYVPQLEKDSCGTGLLADLNAKPSHQLVEDALKMLMNMEHRGACGCEPNTGDGAGILIQTPQRLFAAEAERLGLRLPEFGSYGVGMLFLPKEKDIKKECLEAFEDCLRWAGFSLIGYREVPTDNSLLGESAVAVEPDMVQVFVRHTARLKEMDLERKLFHLRNYTTREVHRKLTPGQQDLFYFASFSFKTIVYKGQLTTWQLGAYFPDLQDERLESAIALIHSRFSTNTVPKWKLAQPFRYIAHNGEINTLTGNLNWWRSREATLKSPHFSDEELAQLKPICPEGSSDSSYFDNVLEMMVMGDRSLPHSMMTMIPEAWENDEHMEEYKKYFYEYHENLSEPWDGPAAICFTNGRLVGATLDRNGLRPARYCITNDDRLIIASEAGALPVEQSTVLVKGRLQPGRMLIADLDEKRIIGDEEVKRIVCNNLPYRDWVERYRLRMSDLYIKPEKVQPIDLPEGELRYRQRMAGYTREDLKIMLEPMMTNGKDPIGSMGSDTPLAVLSTKAQHLANYFKQLFAQVTNPPIDPIRERTVMSLSMRLGGCGNFLAKSLEHARFLRLEHPVLDAEDFAKVKNIWHPHYRTGVLKIQFKADGQPGRLRHALDQLGEKAKALVKEGVNILILSDRDLEENHAPIPSLLATGAIHHRLIKGGLRINTSLVVEAGDVLETHHFATLIGFGATCVHPYLTFATIADLREGFLVKKENPGKRQPSAKYFIEKYMKAVNGGLLKIMSKNGISTLQSYQGAQIFEILGLNSEVVDRCFTGAVSRIEGMGFDEIAEEALEKYRMAKVAATLPNQLLDAGGIFQWKRDGEFHLFNPKSIHLLQISTRKNDYKTFKKYAALINRDNESACTLRGLLRFNCPPERAIPLDEVEPVENILRRFATGAMSFGSISHEAHSTLAIAMNRIGAKSNSGEGGEDPIRFAKKPNGDWERSAIKQVASGRFGVTSHYLTNADELQIKMAQGAKPGEGGQLPGHKVNDWIARVRHSTPGVGLISPPPHHDIYSIEDLAQLIFDLKNANRAARINVKLVSKAGVGVIASGVAKAHADVILIAGHDGGTGASPLSSIRHTGLPWELGIAEAQQALVRNKLRDRVTLQVDGQIRTGKDLAVATLLGAEEWGVATAALVVEGCIMMRKCHLNTCPVGIATQNPELRKRFDSDPQHIVNFFTFLAEDLREIMAELGFRTVNEMVGRADMLDVKPLTQHPKQKHLDLSPLLFQNPNSEAVGKFKSVEQDHGLMGILDWRLMQVAKNTLAEGSYCSSNFVIENTDRATGTLLANEITKRFQAKGLPEGTLDFRFRGSAGQSFGAFVVRGMHFLLEGESNDYFGKGLSGGRLVVTPDREANFEPSENIIIGNVALYGATSGEVYIHGRAGERFAVRNSGAEAVVEGIGDHGCEYMTGGTVVVLGSTGKNFAAGMSGGTAYIYNFDLSFYRNCNMEMVDLDPMSPEDYDVARQLVRNHFNYTGSRLALDILQKWPTKKVHFVKVMPKDLKAVLKRGKGLEVEDLVLS